MINLREELNKLNERLAIHSSKPKSQWDSFDYKLDKSLRKQIKAVKKLLKSKIKGG